MYNHTKINVIGPLVTITKQKKNTDLTLLPHYFPFYQNRNVITKLGTTRRFLPSRCLATTMEYSYRHTE